MNLEAEAINGYYVSKEMKRVWSVQMELLKKLLDVCQKHGLKIWVDSGTLLGAVREKGYIAWDDDIDTIMMREDYDKLCAIASEEFELPYYFSFRENHYPRMHAQLKMDGTAAILPHDIWHDVHQGIFIDIFVFDGVPEDREERTKAGKIVTRDYRKLRFLCSRDKGVKGAIKKMLSKIYFCFTTFDKLYDNIESHYKRFGQEKYGRMHFWCIGADKLEQLNFRKEWYDETVWLPFEDMMVPVPKEYHKRLVAEYGENYMTPCQAPTSHGEVIFDAQRSYVEVIRELREK